MENYIIAMIISVLIVLGIYHTVRHFKGRSGCCGGCCGVPPKKLSVVLYKKTFSVDGMTCKHCKSRVEDAVNGIKGIAGRVDLKKGKMVVSYSTAVSDETIITRIEKLGYKVQKNTDCQC